MGGALSLVVGCDVVLAGRSARFGSAFTRLGLSCDSGSTATLTMRMGMARARLFVRAGAVQLQSQLEEEALAIARVSRSADAQEGIAAMFEKRAPVFNGR